ncbi:MAG TPA: DNA replication protein, partial [bacterium]|nr:DNA replication protein [bacterium]
TTLFTSNYTDSRATTLVERLRGKDAPASEADLVKDTLEERVGPRIYSRLREMCHFVALGGPDRRAQDTLDEPA